MHGCQLTRPAGIYWHVLISSCLLSTIWPCEAPLLGASAETLSGLGFRNHYCMAIFIADTEKAKDERSTSAVFRSKPSWPFRVSNCITWRGVSLYCVTLTTSCLGKSLHTVTSKNRFWPFLKKTLSNNFADKSHSTPTLGHCELYGCVDLFRVPRSIFGKYEPVTLQCFIQN